MTSLSVNVNKIATLRNSRGNNKPNLELVTQSIIDFGADGITVHPRPDQRHITTADVFSLSELINNQVEFNIEGFPSEDFIKLVLKVQPDQVTLVPDKPNVLTSLDGWNTIKEKNYLTDVIKVFKSKGIRTSLFVHPELDMVEGASYTDVDRIELFTGFYAKSISPSKAVKPYLDCSQLADKLDLGVNAGHDLDLNNIGFFYKTLPLLQEVSIGHALISESLFLGLENTIRMYKRQLK